MSVNLTNYKTSVYKARCGAILRWGGIYEPGRGHRGTTGDSTMIKLEVVRDGCGRPHECTIGARWNFWMWGGEWAGAEINPHFHPHIVKEIEP